MNGKISGIKTFLIENMFGFLNFRNLIECLVTVVIGNALNLRIMARSPRKCSLCG